MILRNPSRPVSSPQTDVHPRLGDVLQRHSGSAWKQPLHAPSVRAFEALERLLPAERGRLVLDAGCGTGRSTRLLAEAFPEHVVIGVDKSAARLARVGADTAPRRHGNAFWLRAELETLWRLGRERGWRLQRHYLLYPNPWPKPGQLQRRWHAHPVFPDLLSLGGRLEMRCNWKPYALEFACAINHFLGTTLEPRALGDEPPLSPFERKYHDSGHALYSVVLPSDSNRVK